MVTEGGEKVIPVLEVDDDRLFDSDMEVGLDSLANQPGVGTWGGADIDHVTAGQHRFEVDGARLDCELSSQILGQVTIQIEDLVYPAARRALPGANMRRGDVATADDADLKHLELGEDLRQAAGGLRRREAPFQP